MPSILTIILIVLAGIFFQQGLNYFLAITGRRKDYVLALFGLLCLLGSAYAVSCLFVYRSTDVPSFILASKWMTVLARTIMIILPWFIGLYTGFLPKRFLTALSSLFLLLGLLIVALPDSFLFGELQSLTFHETPWGEQITASTGEVSSIVYLLYVAYLTVILYAIEACRRLFVRGEKGRACVFASLAVFAVLSFLNDTLLDAKLIRSFYLEEYVLFAFLLVVGTWLDARRIRAEGNYRTLFHAVNDAIFVHNAGTGRLLDVNDAAVRLYGTPHADLLKGGYAKLCSGIPPFMAEELLRRIRLATRAGPQVFEWHACRADNGEFFWVEMALRAKVIDGRAVVLADVRDITDRKKAEEERRILESRMRQVQKLESLGLLAGGVAHDFNNLLTAVLGNTALALNGIPDSSPAREPLEGIRNTAHRAADLCRQLLAYSGKGGFQKQSIDLRLVAGEISRILEVTIPDKVRLQFKFDPGTPLILGDPTQMRQVMMNLLTNAMEAIGDRSGIITLSTGFRRMDRDSMRSFSDDPDLPEGTYAVLSVEDSGCGMDEKTRERVCEPFFSTKFAGRGLGMAAVLGIVRGHKGAIHIESTPDKGTMVTVLFPAAAGEVQVPAEKDAIPEDSSAVKTVLVVDDDESVLAAVSRLIGAVGYGVVSAGGGKEALEILRNNWRGIGCVLLDMTMPDMDGGETMKEIRRIDPKMPVILSSGYSEKDSGKETAFAEAAGFLQKPFMMDELKAALKNAMK